MPGHGAEPLIRNPPQPTGIAPPNPGSLFTYSVMAFPLAFAGLPIYLHAPDFYAVNFGLTLSSLGAVLLVLRLFDAFQDPFIGSLSDRLHGARSYVLGSGAVLLGFGLFMLFNPPERYPLASFTLSILICTTGYSVVSINFQALGGLWNLAPSERTKVTASREAVGLAGLLTATVIPALLVTHMDSQAAFRWLSIGYLPLLAVAFVALLLWLKSTPLRSRATAGSKGRWRDLLKDPWRIKFFSIVFLSTFASAIPAVLVLFFIRDRLGAETYTGLFLLIYFLSGAISMALWSRLAKSLGKLRSWQLSMAVGILTFCWAALLGQGDLIAYAFVCALSGLALGAELALPPAILADHIDADEREEEAARLFSVMAFQSKSALAVATGLALPLLGSFGYQPGEPLTPGTGFALSLTYAGLPCVFKLFALAGLVLFEKDLVRLKSAV